MRVQARTPNACPIADLGRSLCATFFLTIAIAWQPLSQTRGTPFVRYPLSDHGTFQVKVPRILEGFVAEPVRVAPIHHVYTYRRRGLH